MGPTILAIMRDKISQGHFHEEVSTKLIILLHKRGDHRLLSNKRALILLNTLYKIFIRAYQLKLTPILMNFISHSQSTFLLERSIHHFLLLISKLLHRASLLFKKFILLKMDMHKAFDL